MYKEKFGYEPIFWRINLLSLLHIFKKLFQLFF